MPARNGLMRLLHERITMDAKNEYDAGMGTTPGMWDMLSEILSEYDEKLPESLNKAIVALRDGKAKVIGLEDWFVLEYYEQTLRSDA